MYLILLSLHSLFRWLILVSILYAVYRGYKGWLGNRTFTKHDNQVRHITATIAHIQLIIGVWIYFLSPLVSYFLQNYSEAVKIRGIRFFGMEHSLMMLLAIVIITFGSAFAKRKTTDREKFKTMALYYTIALIIILISIPWPFSPMAMRPYFREF